MYKKNVDLPKATCRGEGREITFPSTSEPLPLHCSTYSTPTLPVSPFSFVLFRSFLPGREVLSWLARIWLLGICPPPWLPGGIPFSAGGTAGGLCISFGTGFHLFLHVCSFHSVLFVGPFSLPVLCLSTFSFVYSSVVGGLSPLLFISSVVCVLLFSLVSPF